MITPLRVGIAGYGVVGRRRRHFLDLNPEMEVVAVCDRTFDEPRTIDGVKAFKSYQELYGEGLDAVFVCLTNDIAPEVTTEMIKRGIHTFCEKPPGRTVEDIASVQDTAAKHPHIKVMYGFNHRYHESVNDALGIVRSGSLGRVINLRGVYGKSKFISFDQASDWRTKRAVAGGGILLDQGIHMVDLMRLFAGEFQDVHSFVSNAYWKHDVEDNAYALMRTADNTVAMLHSSATQWRHRFNLEIGLERGGITLSGILSGSKSYGAETLTVIWPDDDDKGDPREQTTRYNRDPSWPNEIAAFANAILRDIPIKNGTIEDAYRTMDLVYRIYMADPEWREHWGLNAHLAPAPHTG
ncbi:Gfo/Idh/MocA family oxidoreductase [Nisaea sp.]|uniref:Gfo/Idh/MocA family protein n=1 Tax=Nisaea sp. TaxID=2024842 RepID=UPI002B272580|nr:Gfo/Idh/MocA family oxidoreductase [Nisaea sp.]